MADGHEWDGMIDTPDDFLPADGMPVDGLGFAGEDEGFAPLDPASATPDDLDEEYPLANVFTEEIENVATSDWDVDADALWGGATSDLYDLGAEPGATAFDFPV